MARGLWAKRGTTCSGGREERYSEASGHIRITSSLWIQHFLMHVLCIVIPDVQVSPKEAPFEGVWMKLPKQQQQKSLKQRQSYEDWRSCWNANLLSIVSERQMRETLRTLKKVEKTWADFERGLPAVGSSRCLRPLCICSHVVWRSKMKKISKTGRERLGCFVLAVPMNFVDFRSFQQNVETGGSSPFGRRAGTSCSGFSVT